MSKVVGIYNMQYVWCDWCKQRVPLKESRTYAKEGSYYVNGILKIESILCDTCEHTVNNCETHKKKGWIRERVERHEYLCGKTKVIVRRDFHNNRVVLDFMNSGPCTKYNYNGKWIGG